MPSSQLNPTTRREAIERLGSREYDVLVIGGGVTGAGAALDAATRGLTTGLVEMRDWAAGTSSRSGKLIHGGLRYLEQRDFGLVREALRERSLMLKVLAPHLSRPIQFIYPLEHRVWERAYVGAGLVLYDTMGGAGAVPRHRHLGKRSLASLAPGVRTDELAGGLTFYDVQLDDARHTIELVRTAAQHGADVASAVMVTGVLKDASGAVTGVRARDLEDPDGDELEIRATRVVNATGVWTDRIQQMAGGKPTFTVAASKGVHLLVRREAIDSTVSMFVRAEDSVLFVRTWGRHWLIGTTDTPWDHELEHPAATAADIDYLLRNVNRVLRRPITRDDVDGVFAGLRPLVRQDKDTTSKMSREHAVETGPPGLVTIAGGKYTTYRVMARDAVDEAARGTTWAGRRSRTQDVPLVGAVGYEQARADLSATACAHGLDGQQVEHLLRRYGALTADLDALLEARPDLAGRIGGAGDYVRAEVVLAVTAEGAMHIDDVMTRRTHIAVETPDRGIASVEEVAGLMAAELGWSDEQRDAEVTHYRDRVAAEISAQALPDDAAATAVRAAVEDPRVAAARRIPAGRAPADDAGGDA